MAISRLMDWRASLLRTGRFDDLARQHLFPMALYDAKGVRPVTTPDALADLYRACRNRYNAAEFQHLETRVTSVELPRNGRFRVWSEWFFKPPGQPKRMIVRTIHFMQQTPQGPLAEMLELDYFQSQEAALAYSS